MLMARVSHVVCILHSFLALPLLVAQESSSRGNHSSSNAFEDVESVTPTFTTEVMTSPNQSKAVWPDTPVSEELMAANGTGEVPLLQSAFVVSQNSSSVANTSDTAYEESNSSATLTPLGLESAAYHTVVTTLDTPAGPVLLGTPAGNSDPVETSVFEVMTTGGLFTSSKPSANNLTTVADTGGSPTAEASSESPEASTEPAAKLPSGASTKSSIKWSTMVHSTIRPWPTLDGAAPATSTPTPTPRMPTPTLNTQESRPPLVEKLKDPGLLWLIMVGVLVMVICVAGVICLSLLVVRRRRSRMEHFGGGGRSRITKGGGSDPWAGPVMMAGVALWKESGERDEPMGQNGADETLLSTFGARGAEREGPEGGVGGAGSEEAGKWNEEESLLYIDEEIEAGNDPGGRDGGDAEGNKGREEENGLHTSGHVNGGATFCLTTAV